MWSSTLVCELDYIRVSIIGGEHVRLRSSSHGANVACCNQERGGYLLWVHGTSGQIADGAVLRAGSELPFCELIFRVEKSVEVRPEECYPSEPDVFSLDLWFGERGLRV